MKTWKIMSSLPDGSNPIDMGMVFKTKKAAVHNCEMLQARVSRYKYWVYSK